MWISCCHFRSALWWTWAATSETWPRSGMWSHTACPPLSRGLSPTTSPRESPTCGEGSQPLSSKLPPVSFSHFYTVHQYFTHRAGTGDTFKYCMFIDCYTIFWCKQETNRKKLISKTGRLTDFYLSSHFFPLECIHKVLSCLCLLKYRK